MWAQAANPSPVRVGLDIVDVGRFREILARRSRVAARLFTADELAYAARFGDPAPRLAARFAAKEAAMKALGVGLGALCFHDLSVTGTESGEPGLAVSGRAAELAEERGVESWTLSLTHTALVAAAVVLGVCR